MAFGVLSSLYGEFMQALGASQYLFQLLDRVPLIPLSNGGKMEEFQGKIEFIHVNFSVNIFFMNFTFFLKKILLVPHKT
jgi:hypothetical protein